MASPHYMRFFPDDYLNDTLSMSMEEQGVYMRLLCIMWVNGAKIRKDDRIISRMLGIHLNKWLKVKKSGIMALLSDHSSGYLTQKRLLREYKLVINRPDLPVDNPVDNHVDNLELPVDNFDSDGSTPHDTTLDTRGVTPLVLNSIN